MGPLAQVGLALATSIGAWINLGLVIWFARRAGHLSLDQRLQQSIVRLAIAGGMLTAAIWLCHAPVVRWLAASSGPRQLVGLGFLVASGAAAYAATLLILVGTKWLAAFRGKTRP